MTSKIQIKSTIYKLTTFPREETMRKAPKWQQDMETGRKKMVHLEGIGKDSNKWTTVDDPVRYPSKVTNKNVIKFP